ncbi:MAG TPA: nucleotidyltransferase domain-containing protein [Bdellovibrionales bacterium]|nr:nucleotidyltransferase domain-containing protein [Bdellovibrionales bacterium]
MSDPVVDRLKKDLQEKYGCHTVILYGSRARGDHGPGSDYDIMGVREGGKKTRKAWAEGHAYVDLFVWPESALREPDSSLLYMVDGMVLSERGGWGSRFLQRLREIHDGGPELMPPEEKEFRRVWIRKMLNRVRVDDLEGRYRRTWLQNSLLEDYFVLRDLWYLGSKKGFEYLKAHDPSMLALFEDVYRNPADLKALEFLAAKI